MGKKAAPCGADDGKAESGAKLFKAKCATCHTCNEGGPNKQGPNLFGVIGRQSGQVRCCCSLFARGAKLAIFCRVSRACNGSP